MARGRASNGSGTQPRKRADGRWECRYITGINPKTGKSIRKSIYANTAEECARKLRAATAAIDAGTYLEPKRKPLAVWLNIWLDEYCRGIKPGSRKVYQGDIENHIAPALGAIPLCNLQPYDIQRFINSLQGGSKPLAPRTINRIHAVLHKALSEACRSKYILSNPAKDCVLPKVGQAEIRPFEPEEIQLFMKAIEGTPSEALFFVALNTGMRLSELLGLRWSRVDFNKGTIKVDAQMLIARSADGKRQLGPPKNNKPRQFIAAPAVLECLQQVRQKQREWQAQAGSVWLNPLGLVFTNEAGREIPHCTVEARYTQILKRAGITPHRFHDIRHTFTVESIRAGVDVKTLSAMLGHSSVAFTLEVYAHVTTSMQEEAARKIEAAILHRSNAQ